ncbi:MAG: glycosyltransferase family 9 protein, partial [Pseudobdellovibrionaceae bacterium]
MKKPYKIAIMQLSRVGDIMMMLPLTRALKRTYPGCHITMIVREKYKSALDLFDMINDVVTLKTQDVLQPYLENESDVQQTLDKIEGFIGEVKEKQIDWLINLSFSPVSADFTHAVTQNTNTSFSGYSRYPDGYIQFSDTVAEYFFNEVGTSRSNQIHLTEIFAKMTRTQLIEQDFVCPDFDCAFLPEQNSRYYTIHLGASEEFKRAPFIVIQKSMEIIQDLDPEIAFC